MLEHGCLLLYKHLSVLMNCFSCQFFFSKIISPKFPPQVNCAVISPFVQAIILWVLKSKWSEKYLILMALIDYLKVNRTFISCHLSIMSCYSSVVYLVSQPSFIVSLLVALQGNLSYWSCIVDLNLCIIFHFWKYHFSVPLNETDATVKSGTSLISSLGHWHWSAAARYRDWQQDVQWRFHANSPQLS